MNESKAVTRPANQTVTGFLEVIERVALNPDLDVAKLEKILELQERILDRNAEAQFNIDFSEMQSELPRITKDGEILVPKGREVEKRGSYMKLEDITDAVRPVLQRWGFGINYRTESVKGATQIIAILRHKGGHKETSSIELPADTSGSKNSVQAIGSSITYGKRYTLCAVLNITAEGEDDDGRGASGRREEGPAAGQSRSDQVLNRTQQQRRQPQQDARPATQQQPPASSHAPEVSADPSAADAVPALPGDDWPEAIHSPEDLAKMGLDELIPIADSLTVPTDDYMAIEDTPQAEQLARGRLVAAIQSIYESTARPNLKHWVVDLIGKFAECSTGEYPELEAEAARVGKALTTLGEQQSVKLMRGAARNAKKRLGLDVAAAEEAQQP